MWLPRSKSSELTPSKVDAAVSILPCAISRSILDSVEGPGGHLGTSLHGVRSNRWQHVCARPSTDCWQLLFLLGSTRKFPQQRSHQHTANCLSAPSGWGHDWHTLPLIQCCDVAQVFMFDKGSDEVPLQQWAGTPGATLIVSYVRPTCLVMPPGWYLFLFSFVHTSACRPFSVLT